VQKAYVKSAAEIIEYKDNTCKSWITDKTWKLIKQRRICNCVIVEMLKPSPVTMTNQNDEEIAANLKKNIAKAAAEHRNLRKVF